jgi:hypothetical protein
MTKLEKLQIINETWRMNDTGYVPYTIEIGPPHLATAGLFEDDGAEAAWHRDYHASRQAVVDFDMPNIKPNLGIGTLAWAMGCGLRVNDEADPWINSLITNDKLERVYEIEPPDPANNPVFGRVKSRINYLQEHGGMPLRLVNVASPLVTASMIWDYTQFFIAMMTHPNEVHHLMGLITQATIDYVRLQLETIKNLHTMGHEVLVVPREAGLRVSDDTAALMSPDLYREFGVRYNAILAEEFGGIVVHSCGECKHIVPAILETPGLKGLDLTMPQNTSWEPIKQAAGKVVLSLRHYFWDHVEQKVDPLAYTQKLLETFGRKGVFIVTGVPSFEKARALGPRMKDLCKAS